jgi:NTE family protein
MRRSDAAGRRGKVALVLAGGAARGAYEVGVVEHIVEHVARDLDRDVPLDILCGTSVGALNACGIAAYADEPRARARRLVDVWSSLRIPELIRLDARGLLTLGQDLIRTSAERPLPARPSGLLDSTGLERLLADHVPFERIGEHLRAGRLSAVTVSTTHVRSGKTYVFVERAEPGLPPWSFEPTVVPRATTIGLDHVMASAAVPILFRSIAIDGQFHCDGGLRQNVPLSPARRLGADRVLVINPRFLAPPAAEPAPGPDPAFPGPLFLLGKTLNALLLDRIDTDLARLESINTILEAGQRRFGEGFVPELNRELEGAGGRALRPLRAMLVRPSQDIGKLSAELVRSPSFSARAPGMLGRIMRRLAEGEAAQEADLLSYLLFDGEFAGRLIELGRADARARHDELCAFFEAAARPSDD